MGSIYKYTVVNIQCGSLVVAGGLHQVGEVKSIVRQTWEHMKRPLGEATRLSRILSRTFAKLSQKPVIVLDKLKCKHVVFGCPGSGSKFWQRMDLRSALQLAV